MLWSIYPAVIAECIRDGKLNRIDLVTVLDEPAVAGGLPVIWVINQRGEKQFALQQSHACVNRGAGNPGETWKIWINRFGEFFLVEKKPDFIDAPIEAVEGYACEGIAQDKGVYYAHWVPQHRLIIKGGTRT